MLPGIWEKFEDAKKKTTHIKIPNTQLGGLRLDNVKFIFKGGEGNVIIHGGCGQILGYP